MFFTRAKQPTTLSSLYAKKENILSVFTKTRDELSQLIEEQEDFKKSLEQQIIYLQLDKEDAEKSISGSKNILSKIKSILE